MSNERKNEFLSWRVRLDIREGVPGQGLDDREATWERLMDRFREKPRRRLPVLRRRLPLYGIVAACLLLLVIPGSHLFQERTPSVRAGAARAVAPVINRSGEKGEAAQPAVPMVARGTRGGEAAGGTRAKGAGRSRPDIAVRLELKTAVVTDDTIHSLEAPAAPLISQIAPAAPVPRKKWKVVDLSDLNSTWQPPHGMASNRTVLPLHIGFGNVDPPAAPGGSSPDSDPGIKIKFPISN